MLVFLRIVQSILAVNDSMLRKQNAYLLAENKIYKQLYPQRPKLNDTQRITLAVFAKELGRKALMGLCTLVQPDTLLKWHRLFVAMKYDYSDRRKKMGRPMLANSIEEQVLKIAHENTSWGCPKIEGAMKSLGYECSASSVRNILLRHNIDPRDRGGEKTWNEFIKQHFSVIWATDFWTTEVWTKFGLQTYYVLFFIHLSTRKVHIAGITRNPKDDWMKQIARNITMEDYGFLNDNCEYLIHDRDTKYTCSGFQGPIKWAGIKLVPTPPRSPNLNAFAERFVKTIKEECLNHLIPIGENFLRKSVSEFVEFYNLERPHQGEDIGNNLLIPEVERNELANRKGKVKVKHRLGGLLKFYYRDIA